MTSIGLPWFATTRQWNLFKDSEMVPDVAVLCVDVLDVIDGSLRLLVGDK
jgi:hypothetical protein